MSGLPLEYRERILSATRFFRIAYWVPHLDDELRDASPFMAFLPGILSTARILQEIVRLPMDIRELEAGRQAIALCRVERITTANVLPIRMSAFLELAGDSPFVFNCVVTTPDTESVITSLVGAHIPPWLCIAEDEIVAIDDVVVANYVRATINAIPNSPMKEVLTQYSRNPRSPLPELSVDCPRSFNLTTAPNESSLEALRVSLTGARPLIAGENMKYSFAIIRSSRALNRVRRSLLSQVASRMGECANSITVALDSLIWSLERSDIAGNLHRQGVSRQLREIVSKTVKRSNFTHVHALKSALSSEENGYFQHLLEIKRAEMLAFTAGITLHSSVTFTPVLRLNPGLNRLRGRLSDLAQCARGKGPHREFKQNKITRRLLNDAVAIIGTEIIDELRGPADQIMSVNLISDFPLELVPVDGLALSLRHDVSRIPATPGNVMLAQCAKGEEIHVDLAELFDVLVIRSFGQFDPLRNSLERALQLPILESGASMPRISFVDVSTEDEFVAALDGFKGAIVIFDGHGGFDSRSGLGSIIVGNGPLDIWSLRGRVSLPPIVLLSACDTLPIDGGHGSTAIGALVLGATTVLGTSMPINGLSASIFIHRLIYRIGKYVPLALAISPGGVSWRWIMSGLIRMSFATELINCFELDFKIDPRESRNARVSVNMDINSRNPKWYLKTMRRLASISGKSLRHLESWANSNNVCPDSLRYVQLGRPDLIRIVQTTGRKR